MVPELPAGYPRSWEADVVLRDGGVAHVRAILPDDADGLRSFHAGQSEESIYLRFFAPLRELSDRDLDRFTHVDYRKRVALVVTLRDQIIGIGRYDAIDAKSAEVAFNISDHFQGRGIGSVLLEHLAAIAQEEGITRFTAEVLPQNRKMLSVFSEAGYDVSRHIEDGVVSVTFDISPTERSVAVRVAREHRAEALSMHAVLHPSSIAVVGASRRPESIGHRILADLDGAGFTGRLHVVNREAMEVLGRPAYASVGDIPDEVDLVIVAVPAAGVLEVVADCAAKGVKALVVVASGFAEAGKDGARLQRKLLKRARRAGMRVVGPNSFGILNNDPTVRLNATLTPRIPGDGGLGLFAQSGALGIAVLASAARRNLGVSHFASAGNRVDVSGNDFMQYWIDDDRTTAVGLYLESMGNPRKFSRIARQLAAHKPVIVVKSGSSSFGVPPGHEARQTRSNPNAFTALLRQAGVLRVNNIHELFDVAQLVLNQPLPAGRRVGIVGNSAALGIVTADACVGHDLDVVHGPVSLGAEASIEQFREAVQKALADPDVDSVLASFIPPLLTADEEVVDIVREAGAVTEKPCVATFLGMRGVDGGTRLLHATESTPGRGLPVYAMPEDAVRALAAATRYAEWRAKDRGIPVAPVGIDRRAAELLVEELLAANPEGVELAEADCERLLAAYGIHLWRRLDAHTAEEAVDAAEAIGYPVVLKSTSSLVRHQSAVAGIRVDLEDAEAVRTAFASLRDRLVPLAANTLVVQHMASTGVACVIGTSEDP
ncbi:MAG: GNAT family N-acetyltransferase, partial [Nostocoides sp.]